MRLAGKWPVDKNKSKARNYRYFLEKQIGYITGNDPEKLEKHRDDVPNVSPEELPPSYHEANMRGMSFFICCDQNLF
jgi:hypothetical protein